MKRYEIEQEVAAEILTQFMFVNNMDDVNNAWDDIYKRYGLCDDPFTKCPCSPREYAKNSLEYQRQVAIERYGHCDWLE